MSLSSGTANTWVYNIYAGLFYLCYVYLLPDIFCSLSLYATLGLGIIGVFFSHSIKVTGYLKGYTFFTVTIIISYIVSGGQGSIFSVLKEQAIVILMGMIVYSLFVSKQRIRLLYIFIVYSALIAVLWLFLSGQLRNVVHINISFTDSINALALLYIIPFAGSIMLWNYYRRISPFFRILYLGISIVFFIFIGITGSRTALIAAVVFVLVYGLAIDNREKQGAFLKRFLVISVIAVATFFVVWKIPALYDAIGSRIDGLIDSLFGRGIGEFSANRRLDIIDLGWKAFLQKPIFGYGIDGFKRATGLSYYAHNTYIEILCDFGIVGFIAYYSIFVVAIKQVTKALRETADPIYRFLLAALVAVLISEIGTVDYNVWSNQVFLVLAFITTQREFIRNNKMLDYGEMV